MILNFITDEPKSVMALEDMVYAKGQYEFENLTKSYRSYSIFSKEKIQELMEEYRKTCERRAAYFLKQCKWQETQTKHHEYEDNCLSDFDPYFTTDYTLNPDFHPEIITVEEQRQASLEKYEKWLKKRNAQRRRLVQIFGEDIESLEVLHDLVDDNVETYFDAVSVTGSYDIPDFIRYNNRKYLVWKPTFLGTLSSGSQAASQHHCRSFLLASCQQKSDDDLLGD